MTIYIRQFRLAKSLFGKPKLKFEYFTGLKWKALTVDNNFVKDNSAKYSRYVMDCVIKDICGKETDPLVRADILNRFDSDIACMAQLNSKVFVDATKLFS